MTRFGSSPTEGVRADMAEVVAASMQMELEGNDSLSLELARWGVLVSSLSKPVGDDAEL